MLPRTYVDVDLSIGRQQHKFRNTKHPCVFHIFCLLLSNLPTIIATINERPNITNAW